MAKNAGRLLSKDSNKSRFGTDRTVGKQCHWLANESARATNAAMVVGDLIIFDHLKYQAGLDLTKRNRLTKKSPEGLSAL